MAPHATDEETVEEGGDEVPPLGGSSSRHRVEEPTRRSKSKTVSESSSTNRDIAGVARAVGDAWSNGAASGRMGFEGLQRAFLDLLGQLNKAHEQNASLMAQLGNLSSQNPTLALIQAQNATAAEQNRLATIEKWKTVRDITPQLLEVAGPAAGPLVTFLMKKFGVAPPIPIPETGDKSPRAVAQRVVGKLFDGSESSITMTEMFQAFVEEECKEDFQALIEFLRRSVTAAEEPKK